MTLFNAAVVVRTMVCGHALLKDVEKLPSPADASRTQL